MPQATFPEPGPDDAEPGGYPPADQDPPGPEQGLYITLPAEHLTLSGFCQGGAADTMAPGPLLATVVHTVAGPDGSGLAGCSDDQLMGIISAARRQQSRDEWTVMAAIAEFARRAGAGVEGEFAADELASELHMSQQSAAGQMDFATEVAKRLPQTFAALAAGQIHPIHLRIIEDETRILSPEDAARADAFLAGAAPGMTFGELRYAARKLVLKLDPDAARKRKEAAKCETHVRRFREESGNAGMVARELPSDEVLASWQHVEQRALDLRAAGVPGTLQDLRVRAYLDLLQERDSRTAPEGSAASAAGCLPRDQPAPAGPAASPATDEPPPDQPPPDTGPPGPRNGPGGPCPAPDAGPSLAALVTITIPLTTYQGRSDTPGEADGYGILDGDDARDLAAAAARHPRTRWCVTALNPDGTAAAHGCLPGRHPPPATGPPGRHPPPGTALPGTGPPSILSTPLTPSRSPGVPATTPTPRPATGPAANSSTWSAPAAPGAPPPAAVGPPPAATWTIPSPGTRAASPANAGSHLSADITTGANRPKGGGWRSPNQASSSGAPRRAGPTPRHRPSIRPNGYRLSR